MNRVRWASRVVPTWRTNFRNVNPTSQHTKVTSSTLQSSPWNCTTCHSAHGRWGKNRRAIDLVCDWGGPNMALTRSLSRLPCVLAPLWRHTIHQFHVNLKHLHIQMILTTTTTIIIIIIISWTNLLLFEHSRCYTRGFVSRVLESFWGLFGVPIPPLSCSPPTSRFHFKLHLLVLSWTRSRGGVSHMCILIIGQSTFVISHLFCFCFVLSEVGLWKTIMDYATDKRGVDGELKLQQNIHIVKIHWRQGWRSGAGGGGLW